MANIFLIAGEASGDSLGAGVMKALKDGKPGVAFSGIGGPFMKEQGLESLLPMNELCVMGVFEVLGHLPRLLRLMRGIAEEIEKKQPDIVLTIDLPDFNFRLAALLKKRGIYKGKIVHYVAPTVWAWRPGRAKKIAQYLDGLICLFPFEPQYFEPHGLKSIYAGHPVIEEIASIPESAGADFRALIGVPQEAKLLGVYLGSRTHEIEVHGDIFRQAVEDILETYPDMHVIVPTLEHLEYNARAALAGLEGNVSLISDPMRKMDVMAACDAAVAVSGTVGLELAVSDVPHVIGYKTSVWTWLILRLVMKVKYAHLANILLKKKAVPEFLQGKCEPGEIADGVLPLLKDEQTRDAQLADFKALREVLQANDGVRSPSQKAAAFLSSYL